MANTEEGDGVTKRSKKHTKKKNSNDEKKRKKMKRDSRTEAEDVVEREKKRKVKKRKHKRRDEDDKDEDDDDGSHRNKEKRKRKSKERLDDNDCQKKRRKKVINNSRRSDDRDVDDAERHPTANLTKHRGRPGKGIPFDYKYILAPMVGASELAFRLLCRKYGAQLAYTPMMSSAKFASDPRYRTDEFQTLPEDRPLVCHFSANDPEEFAAAARLVEGRCDAIDLNLGCPQRTAYVGHFGSYLLGKEDRELILNIVRAGSRAVSVPIFVKIRLLDTIEETIELCEQLRDAGASLIAVHARYRASFERKGPGARDGPALLDQVLEIKKAVPEIPIISNGNIVNFDDVIKNLGLTKADGVMSAEGILDNPALYLPRYGPNDREARNTAVHIADPSPLPTSLPASLGEGNEEYRFGEDHAKRKRKLTKLLKEIGMIEEKINTKGADSINEEQRKKFERKTAIEAELKGIEEKEGRQNSMTKQLDSNCVEPPKPRTAMVPLKDLYVTAGDKLALAEEYLNLARLYPVKIRSVVFHTRRMCKDLLNQFQLMEDCVACHTMDEVGDVLVKIRKYREDPASFRFDRDKAAREKEALENKRREEGKRKAYEARMVRKAKREGKSDLEHYLRIGAELPTVETLKRLRPLSKKEQLAAWIVNHSQHCLSYHLDPGGCSRDRACAFLHVDAKGLNTFDEREEVAG